MSASPVADLVVEALAADLLDMADRAVRAELERRSYRELAQVAIGALHDAELENHRLRRRLNALLDERRASIETAKPAVDDREDAHQGARPAA